MKRTLAATLAAVTLGAGALASQAAGAHYGGVSYVAYQPQIANCVQHNFFEAWSDNATVTGTFSARVMYVSGGTWRVFNSRDIQILRGTRVDIFWDLTNGNREGVRFRNQAKFASGSWSVSAERVGPRC